MIRMSLPLVSFRVSYQNVYQALWLTEVSAAKGKCDEVLSYRFFVFLRKIWLLLRRGFSLNLQ